MDSEALVFNKNKKNKMGIFDKRINLKPYEYKDIYSYVDAIRNSYWIHTEFNFTSDVQDFNTELSENERTVIKRTLLAIAQIEVSVKDFWWDIGKHIPKPEISAVGHSFSESEVRHADAYSHLLEVLGFNDEFNDIDKIPAIIDRMDYLQKIKDSGNFTETLLLFSVFVEHISLFSQFLIAMAFNKEKNVLKWTSNVIEATSKEENLHGMFGLDLYKIIVQEHPELRVPEERMYKIVKKAFRAEHKILEWIFEDWELDFLPGRAIENFIADRFNKSLISSWYEAIFCIDQELLEGVEWFDDELNSTKHGDFFVKRSVNYNKFSKPITEDDLF